MAALALTLAPAAAGAAPITVNTTGDGAPAADGSCTLREAITNANADTASSALPGECAAGSGADAIDFAAAVRPAITLNSALPVIKTSITINGPGAALLDVQRNVAVSSFRIFSANRTAGPLQSFNLSGLTISDGKVVGGAGVTSGGGINSYGFDLSLDHVIVQDNALQATVNVSDSQASVTVNGAGVSFYDIFGDGQLTIKDSVIRDNSATGDATFTGPPAGGMYARAVVSGVGIDAGRDGSRIERTTVSGNSGTASASAPNTSAIANVYGAAIDVSDNDPDAVIAASTISDNAATATGKSATATGGITYSSPMTLDRVTVTGNSAASTGPSVTETGGVEGSEGTIVSSTIAGNTSGTSGEIANLRMSDGAAAIRNTIVANPLGGANCDLSPAPTEDHNLEFPGTSCGFTGTGSLQNVAPSLGALAANGGPTETLALPAGSPALDRVPAAGCALTDQRGLPRPQTAGTPCDMGAYELQVPDGVGPPPPAPPAPSPPIYTGDTGLREKALRRCFRKKFRGHRKKCRKKARKLPK